MMIITSFERDYLARGSIPVTRKYQPPVVITEQQLEKDATCDLETKSEVFFQQRRKKSRQLGLLINGTACTSPNSLLFFLWCNSAVRCTLTPDRACCTSLGCVARLPSGAGSASRRLSRGVRKGATQAPLELLSFQICRFNPPPLCAQIDILQYTRKKTLELQKVG